MPHSASAKKRNRQNLRDRERNRAIKSDVKTHVRKLLAALSAGDAEGATEHFRGVTKKVDKAAASRTIHRNRAARIKSRLSARLKAAGAKAPKAAKA